MDWKTFIAEIISTLAWPAVVMFIIWQLKDNISNLLPRIKKLKYKDTEVEFMELIQELSSETKDVIPIKSKEIEKSKNTLYKLAKVSSRSAIIEAYRLLEVMAIKSIEIAYPELSDKNIKNQVQIAKMLRDKVLTSEEYFQLRELRNLRNTAAHHEEFSLTGDPIERYIDIAVSLTNTLETYNKTLERNS